MELKVVMFASVAEMEALCIAHVLKPVSFIDELQQRKKPNKVCISATAGPRTFTIE